MGKCIAINVSVHIHRSREQNKQIRALCLGTNLIPSFTAMTKGANSVKLAIFVILSARLSMGN